MPTLTPEEIDDVATLTLSNFKKNKWTDLSLEYPEYVASSIINEKNVEEQGGKDVNFKIKTQNTGTAKVSGMYAVDETQVTDVMIDASVPWAKQTVNYSYEIDEDGFQSDRETIIRLLKIREHDALSDMAELQEELLWGAPSATTDKSPMGIPFWLQKDATTTPAGGFNGGNPSGFSAGAAGVSSTDYPRWRNWTFGYTNVSSDDLVKKVKKSLYKTAFKAPVPHPELGWGESKFCIYSTYAVREPLERLAETRNDNLGADVAKYIDAVTIGGVPLKAVHYLDANDTSDPLYGVNWSVMRPMSKSGASMRRTKPMVAPHQHTVRNIFIDNWMQYICFNRRRTWVGSTS